MITIQIFGSLLGFYLKKKQSTRFRFLSKYKVQKVCKTFVYL